MCIEDIKSEIESLKNQNENIKHMLNLFEESEVKMKYFKCDQCEESFISETSLHVHINMKHPTLNSEIEGDFHCEMCKFKCKRNVTLNKHINSKHPNLVISNPFKCKLCD